MAIPSQGLKTCSQCGEVKSGDDFYRAAYRRKTKVPAQTTVAECKVCRRNRTHRGYWSDHDIAKARNMAWGKTARAKLKATVFAHYGGTCCACCGETEPMFLTLDHIDNDGAAFRRKIAGSRLAAGYTTYRWLAKNGFPPGFQVLCMNCNHGKRMNNGICPHQARCNDQAKAVGPSGPKRSASLWDEDMVCSPVKAGAA